MIIIKLLWLLITSIIATILIIVTWPFYQISKGFKALWEKMARAIATRAYHKKDKAPKVWVWTMHFLYFLSFITFIPTKFTSKFIKLLM